MTSRNDPGRLLGVFAHPDDETFCAGGTMAKYVAAGAEAMIVSVTRGEAGQIRDAHLASRRTLGQVREQELRRACQLLGVQHVRCLDYVDGTLKDVDPRALTADIVLMIRTFRPDVVLTFGRDGTYGHPDHVTISAVTTEACALAGRTDQFAGQLSAAVRPHAPGRLYHSHFPRSRLLLADRLAQWLVELNERFRGSGEFVQALSLFAQESTTTLRYASDYIDVKWFPPGYYIVEQGELGSELFLILSGEAEVVAEDPDGNRQSLARLGGGEFFGELGVAYAQPRTAHVIAISTVTCLVFSAAAPSLFAGRGKDARLAGSAGGLPADQQERRATTVIDVSAHVGQKIAAVAAHQTQFPVRPEVFPAAMLQEMFSQEFFMRVLPPIEPETEL